MADTPITLITPYGPRASTCGYCGPTGSRSAKRSSYTFGVDPVQLSCSVYQKMIDRGWRRSGTYLYKPDLSRSCCPQYTIRQDSKAFAASKSQRKLLNRFNRFVMGDKVTGGPGPQLKTSLKGKDNERYNLVQEIASAEHRVASAAGYQGLAHKFEVTYEPSECTAEKFALYERYQREVHHDAHNDVSGFTRFLCDTPLKTQAIPYSRSPPDHLPKEYGSYHVMYRLDGELIALGVIDILPNCVSSVYFMYDPKWEQYSLGKVSALREIALVQELADYGAPEMCYLYMGFYIQSCQKMRYKGQYPPSFLLEPEEYTWYPLEKCTPLLDRYRYVPFAHPSRAQDPIATTNALSEGKNTASSESAQVGDEEEDVEDDSPPSGVLSPSIIDEIQVVTDIKRGTVLTSPAPQSRYWRNRYTRELITNAATLLGEELAREVIFITSDQM